MYEKLESNLAEKVEKGNIEPHKKYSFPTQ